MTKRKFIELVALTVFEVLALAVCGIAYTETHLFIWRLLGVLLAFFLGFTGSAVVDQIVHRRR
jgi:hypothetical protein